MRLSDAILLGSTVVAAKPGRQYSSESESGCALGMAAIARGCGFERTRQRVPEQDRRTLGTEGVWGSWVMREVARPCNCWRLRVPHEMRIKDIIAHLFDYHVMRKRNWTLERLAAWVETVEPKEVVPPDNPSWDRLRAMASQIEDGRREAEEWQAVRHAFEAKHDAKRTRGRSARIAPL
jgi:hypothetical protein